MPLLAGQQPAFCRYHLGSLGEAAATAVCGSQPWWWGSLWFWEPRAQRVVVFKPGASKLSLWWNLPHRWDSLLFYHPNCEHTGS